MKVKFFSDSFSARRLLSSLISISIVAFPPPGTQTSPRQSQVTSRLLLRSLQSRPIAYFLPQEPDNLGPLQRSSPTIACSGPGLISMPLCVLSVGHSHWTRRSVSPLTTMHNVSQLRNPEKEGRKTSSLLVVEKRRGYGPSVGSLDMFPMGSEAA